MYQHYRATAMGNSVQKSSGGGGAQPEPEPEPVPALVDTAWLQQRLEPEPGTVKVVDCSWHMPQTGRKAGDEYTQAHIPGAVFFDLDECRDKDAEYGQQILPSEEKFSEYVGQLGVSDTDHVVLYDNNEDKGLFSSPRAWFIFRVFGHKKVSVLDGGLPQWKAAKGEVNSESTAVSPTTYETKYRANLVKSYQDVLENLESKKYTYVDARPLNRFLGKAPEPVPGIKPGHVPGSVDLPFPQFLASEPKVMKPVNELKDIFKSAGVDFTKPNMVSCGTGLTACVVVLAAYLCGYTDVPVYDGAWVEWFQRAETQLMEDVPQDD